MIVNDTGQQLFIVSIVILSITLLRLVHLISNDWWAMESLFLFFGSVFVELYNHYIPLDSWKINSTIASIISLVVSTLIVQTVYSYFIGGGVALMIIAVIILTCYMGQDGVDWFNSWLPRGVSIDLTSFVVLVLLLGLLVWVLYKWALEWKFLQYVLITIVVCFVCSLCLDVLYELIISEPNAINVLDFDLSYWIILLITTVLYLFLEYLGNRYLPPTPHYHCFPPPPTKKKNKNKNKNKYHYESVPMTENMPSPSTSSEGDEEGYGYGEQEQEEETKNNTRKEIDREEVYRLLSLPKSTL